MSTVFDYVLKKLVENKGLQKTQTLVQIYLSADFSYQSLYAQLKNELHASSLEDLYRKLDEAYFHNKYQQTFKNLIKKSQKEDCAVSWQEFRFILKQCSAGLKQRFITKYILKNIECSLMKNFTISTQDWTNLRNRLELFLQADTPSAEPFISYADTESAAQSIASLHNPLMHLFVYKNPKVTSNNLIESKDN